MKGVTLQLAVVIATCASRTPLLQSPYETPRNVISIRGIGQTNATGLTVMMVSHWAGQRQTNAAGSFITCGDRLRGRWLSGQGGKNE